MTKKKDNDIISRIPKWAWLLLSLLAAMLLWVVLSQNPVTARSFSPPWVTFAAIQTMISRGVLFQDIASSLISAGIGFALGFFIGVPVAFLMAWYRPVRYILEPWIQFIRNIPPLAYGPRSS